ncbi:MAG: hypothetical protein R3D89_12320 [Sphingomonadaceae bacterium]
MNIFKSRTAVAVASAAVLSMTATPAFARGWHHRDRGIDGGDVVAGILIIGGIAAIASAASNANKNKRYRDSRDDDYRDYRDRDYRERDGRYGDDRYDDRRSDYRGAGGMDAAVDTCVAEVERGNRQVDTVDGANRDGSDWRIEGRMTNGSDFACTIGNDMRVRSATVDGRGVV